MKFGCNPLSYTQTMGEREGSLEITRTGELETIFPWREILRFLDSPRFPSVSEFMPKLIYYCSANKQKPIYPPATNDNEFDITFSRQSLTKQNMKEFGRETEWTGKESRMGASLASGKERRRNRTYWTMLWGGASEGSKKPVISEIEPEIRNSSKTIGSVQSAWLEKKVLLSRNQSCPKPNSWTKFRTTDRWTRISGEKNLDYWLLLAKIFGRLIFAFYRTILDKTRDRTKYLLNK